MNSHRTTLVVGYDRSSASHCALEVSMNLGSRLGAVVHVVHVMSLVDFPADIDCDDWEESGDDTVRDARDKAQSRLKSWGGEWSWRVEHGSPTDALITVTLEVDAIMIIVGAHESGIGAAIQRLLGGSVNKELILRSERPVLVVPDIS